MPLFEVTASFAAPVVPVDLPGIAENPQNPSKPPLEEERGASRLPVIQKELRAALRAKVIDGLDALRALAITLVLIDHFRIVHAPTGSMGVMIFFVLSGFLISSILLKEYRKSGTISLRNFYRRRAFRIFPTFYLCWILTTVVELLAHQYYWKTSVVSFFYMMDYGRALAPTSLQPYLHLWISWSLAIEEKFYLLWPLLLLVLLKRRTGPAVTLTFIILGQWIYRAILYLGFHVNWFYCYSTFDMRADALLIGCLLAILLEQEKTARPFSWWLRQKWLSALPVVALTLLLVLPVVNRPLSLFLWSVEPLIIAILLVQFVYWGAGAPAIWGSAPIRFLARISYALYLYHPLATQIVFLFHIPHLGYSSAVLLLLMSVASYYWIERPFMRMRENKRPGVLRAAN